MASLIVEEPRTDEAAVEVNVSMGVVGEERHIIIIPVVEELASSEADTTMAEPQKERPPEAAEQEVSAEMAPPTMCLPLKWMKGDLQELYPTLLLRPSQKVRRYL